MYKIEEILLRGSGSTLESVVEAHGPCIHPLLSSLKPASEYSIEVNEGILHLIAEICSSISSSSWKYALQYFSPKFPPFGRFLRFSQGNFPKRRKIQKSSISDESMAWATLTLVQSDPFFRDLWDWSSLSTVHPSISDNLSEKTGWLIQRTFSILLDLNPGLITSSHVHFSPPPMPSIPYNSSGIVMPQENLAQIQGISLKGSLTPDPAFVLLPSRTSFLQSICLAVSSGSPCLLSGPTGSGKTRLVEHLARRLSKRKFFDFNSVRLNDQTDGRALIGGYVCTQVPGQFLWKRGILTKAFLEGDWLLVEDAGKASPDVKSLLTQIIETRSLYISHFGRSFKAAPGFQLFLTATSSREDELLGLDSSPYHIPLSDFSFSDTSAIIDSLFAQKLGEGTCFKLVKTYEIVSKMDAMSRIRRILSLRDLLKWCGRIFSLNDREDVFFNGIDALCQWIPDKHVQLEACHVIGRFVNFNQDEISHLLKKHHPRLLPSKEHLQVGRVSLPKSPNAKIDSKFALTRSSSNLLEFLSCAVGLSEPVLLIGETGVGKTSSVQYLCSALGKTLRVVNMSQQSDNSDLLGAYKPVDTGIIVMATRKRFELLFSQTFSVEENRKFLRNVSLCVQGKSWSKAIALFAHVCDNALKFLASENNPLTQKWKKLQAEIKGIQKSLSSNVNIMFSFVKGVLSEALESGEWILLDEINLAEPETLECLTDIISKEVPAVISPENPEESVRKHPEFRVFACMNPPTDVGKSNLPSSLRNQFTEYFIHEPENENELIQIVSKYISDLNVEVETIQSIVNFYLMLKVNASKRLCAGNGAIPIFSLRTLCRALRISAQNKCSNVQRSIFEAFSVCFLTELDKDSYQIVLRLLIKYLAGDKKGSKFLKEQIPKPIESKSSYVNIEGYWIQVGEIFPQIDDKYILTKSVRKNLKDISRIVSNCDLPVLIQGETSVGKTSLITYLANASGNRCYRINNHEHTDIQEYIGTYTMDESGLFSFKEGVLVEAMKNGAWIILDELNLAPTEVLEALNRVLDDNRELFIAETQTIVKAHKNFRLFATQNPAGMYGGRKVLSRAFRNRFIQLNFDEVPTEEIEVIVEKSCDLPRSMSKKMVKVMSELQALRRSSAAFEGKRGYITLRDLFRWGRRFNMAAQTMKSNDTFYDWNQHFAEEGYMVLVSRIRCPEEEEVVKKKIEKIMKVSLKENEILSFTSEKHALATSCEQLFLLGSYEASGIVWTRNAQRMAILLLHALRFKEPVLLVGETGCGKTTIVQEVSHFLKKKLKIINCHLHTETSDFLGSLRPGREEGESLFQWADGPLIQTMKSGDLLLVDEISLADDSVIERMNSVLEPSRKLLLAEKASQGSAIEEITAKSSFQLIATMNPGGDFGKKELSPALRNRFFEVWCPCANRDEDLHILIRRSLEAQFISPPEYTLVRFLNWLKSASNLHLSIRDLMTWITFINKSQSALSNPNCSIVHGICLVLFDGYFMMNNLVQASTSDSFREDCKKFFQSSLQDHDPNCSCLLWIFSEGGECSDIVDTPSHFGIQPFVMPKTSFANPKSNFSFKNKTTAQNAFKLLRGFCLDKPMLLEGPPGVGKSSIVESLAALSGHQLVRINLSDQTEISDLFGTDLPIENLGDSSSKEQIFAWRDGPLLSALKDGHWILLDELNLATQSVLEGLNACLDHRGEIFIPELNKVFTIKKGLTKIFGCQNPFAEGGDRKGLPKSFLNRFVRVNVNALTNEDIWSICKIKFPSVSPEFVRNLISCLQDLKDAMRDSPFVGGPWSINLRDISRFLGAIESKNGKHSSHYVHHLFETIFVSRFRSEGDAEITRGIYNRFFPRISSRKVSIYMNTHNAFVGMCKVPRSRSYFTDNSLMLLPSQSKPLEHVMTCVENRLIPILVGEGSVGKSAIVKVAAQMTGAELVTVSLSAGCDTNDLLGGFEQTDIIQEIARVRNRLIKELKKMAAREDQFNNEADTLLTLVCILSKDVTDESSFFQILTELKNTGHASIHELIEREERDLLAKYERHGKNKFFKWIDSNLVQALIQGSWVLMDNANFCSSSVLDRLNGLLEDGGCLELYEHGLVDGSHRRITPHLDFRIFFTMNPRNGELSPAMRNRCVEIFLPPDTLDNDASKLSLSASIIGPELASALLLLNYSKDFNVMETSKCFKELLLNGWPLKESLAYMKNLVSKESRTNILQSQYHPQVISFESISSDPSYIIPMKQLEMLRNCIPNSNLVILFFLLFSSKDDLCIRLHLLGSSIDSTRLSSLLQDLDSLPLERRALLTYIQPEESSTITQVSVKLAFELTSIKVASLALPLNPSLELKNASGALQTFLSQTLAPECDLSGVSNENWNSFNLVFTYVEHMIRLIEESDSKSNPIAKLTILWIKLKSVLEALGLLNNSSFSLKCVDRHLTLHLENDHESIDRSVFMESTGQRGFLTVSELNGFSDMLKRNAVWTLEDDLSHLVTLRKTLQQAKNWFRLADHKSLIPNEGRFSPFFNYSLNAFNDSKLPGKEFLASVAMKWEEIQWGSKEASPCLLLNKMIFPETDDITLENFEDKCKELQNIQTQIADNYSLILRKNEEKNAVTLSRAKMICSVFSQELSSSLLFNEVQQIRELIPKAHDEEDILIHARLKMLVGLVMFRVGLQLSTVDIAEKMQINLSHLEEVSLQIKHEMNAADICNCLEANEASIRNDYSSSTHPHREALLQDLKSYEKEAEALQRGIPIRSENYGSLLSDILQIRENNGSLNKIRSLFNDLFKQNIDEQVLQKVSSWSQSMIQFCKNILSQYPSFIDIVAPILDGLTSLMEGMHLMVNLLNVDLKDISQNLNRLKSSLNSRHRVFCLDFFEVHDPENADSLKLLLSSNHLTPDPKHNKVFLFDATDKFFALGDNKTFEALQVILRRDFSSIQHTNLFPRESLQAIHNLPIHFNVFKAVRNLIGLYFKESQHIVSFLGGQVPSSQFPDIKSSLSEFTNVKAKTLEFLDIFAENPLLTDIFTVTQRILEFPVRSPLSKFQEGIVLLLPKVETWNKNAPKIYRIPTEPLDVILFNWQKLELSNVELEFDNIFKSFGENSCDELWRIFKSLNLGSVEAPKRKIIMACFRFLCSSNIGEFERRIKLSRDIILILNPFCEDIVQRFDILMKYFEHVLPSIEKAISAKIEELTRETKLALKSEFISYRKYRSASKRTTHKKIVSSLIEFLREPIFKFLKVNSPFEPIEWIISDKPQFQVAKEYPQITIEEKLEFYSNTKRNLGDVATLGAKSNTLLSNLKLKNSLSESFASNLKDIFSSYSEIPHKALIDDPKGFHKYSKIITEVLKTMKDLGMSYKFGLLHEVGFVNFVTASEITNYPEHFVHILMRYEELREIYFSRSPNKKQLNPGTMQRIDGSLSHAILYAAFFNGVIRSADGALSDLRSLMGQTDKSGFNHWVRWGHKTGMTFNDSSLESAQQILGVLASKSNIPKHDKADAEKAKKILISFGSHLHALESTKFKEDLSSVLTKLSTDSEKLRLIQSNVVSDILRDVNIHRIILDSHIKYYNQWLKQAPLPASCPNHLRDHLLKTCESILGVVQAYVKLMESPKELESAVEVRQAMNEEMSVLKVDVLMRSLKALASLSSFEPRLRLSSIEPLLNTYASMIESFKIRCQGVAVPFDEYIRSTLEVFIDYGKAEFKHPPEEEDKDEDKQGGDDKGPKEGCGLGEGTGTDNVSSEIPDEDMLEGAERPEDQEKQEEKDDEENGPKEDDGIEMADDFDDGKFEPQEKDEKEEEGSENEEEKEELDQKEEDVEEDTELDDDLWKDEEKDEEPEDKSTEKDDQVTEDRKDQTQKSQANREHRDNKNKPQDPEEEDNPEVNEQEEQEEEDDPDEKRKDLDDSENDETEEEEKRKREDEEFSDGEELDLDVLDDKKLDEHEPEDLNMDDMNIEDDNDEEMPDMTKDDLEDYDKPDFEDPEFDLDEDKTEEAGGDFSENDPKENASNIPEGSKNETLEEDTAVNNQDSIDGSNMDAESQEQDSTPQPQNVQPNKEKSKANEKSKASKDNQDVKDVEIAHKDEKEESKRDDESKAHDNLPEEEEREEDPSVVETMDHKQLKDHSGKEKEEDKEEEDNKMDVDDVANPMPKIEDENLLPTHGAERPNDSFFSSGQPLAVGAANMPASTSLIPVTSEPLRPISFSSQSAKEWSETLGETSSLSQNLISKLRLLFEPTKANRLKGDYKAGKRLNMRKIIPYIASHFRKDKIWLKRTKVSKRDYHILFALDDSQSMSDNDASKMAIQALATVSQAFNVLEVGKLGVIKFGETAELVQPFKSSGLTPEDGARIIEGFQFAQSKTSILSLIEESSAAFVRCGAEVSNSLSQLLVIISDGRGVFHEGKEELLASLRRAASLNIFIMFVIVETGRDSILDIRFPVFDDGHNLLRIESYMDNFPFNYYILLKDMISLPTTLCGALQQWFEMSQFK